MGKKVGLTLDRVVTVAAAVADRDGLEATSLRAVADALGIKTPSLYNHVAGLPGLRRELALYAAGRVAEIFGRRPTGEGWPVTIRRLARDYRSFAREHPGLYQSMLPAPRPGDDDELYAAMAEPVVSLRSYLIDAGVPEEQGVDLIRAMRSMIHGFVDLEMKDGFGMPQDIDSSFESAVTLVIEGIFAHSR